jgi:hypothetical protein
MVTVGEDSERLVALRERARASLADPRPSLTEAETDAHLRALFGSAGSDGTRRPEGYVPRLNGQS